MLLRENGHFCVLALPSALIGARDLAVGIDRLHDLAAGHTPAPPGSLLAVMSGSPREAPSFFLFSFPDQSSYLMPLGSSLPGVPSSRQNSQGELS